MYPVYAESSPEACACNENLPKHLNYAFAHAAGAFGHPSPLRGADRAAARVASTAAASVHAPSAAAVDAAALSTATAVPAVTLDTTASEGATGSVPAAGSSTDGAATHATAFAEDTAPVSASATTIAAV